MLGVSTGCISPTLSASPPPAPPPQPPAFRQMNNNTSGNNRGGCIRCRFNNGTPRHDVTLADGHLHSIGQPTINYGIAGNNTYTTGYDARGRLAEEEDSACPALLEREFHSLHRNVPGLRRAGVDTNAIRQHFYPDGGWGWIICGVAFLAHVLTTGFQLSYGLLLIYAIPHLGHEMATETGWLGSTSWSVSMLTAPIVIALCRRKSTRLTAVIGGLILALGILFSSFATQFHQVAFSYGIIVGVGAAMVRESSAVMLGHYFKRRRQFVEMITMSGEGVGITLFSVIFKEFVGNKNMGWRLGLQFVTGLVSFCFFMGLFYRPASLYHPQRRAILHLKNQRKKVKEKKTHIRTPKPPFIDFTPFKSSKVRMLIIISMISSIGVYAPIFFMSLHGYQQGYDVQDLVLLQTFLGLSLAFGVVVSGSTINKVCELGYRKINITRQHVCQISILLASVTTLILSGATGYRSLCFIAWGYGFGLGGYRYSLKMLALERIRAKHFTKAWGFIRGAESISVLLGVPLTAFLNESSHRYGRAGYYVCSAVTAISSILMFFIGYPINDGNGGGVNNGGGGGGGVVGGCGGGSVTGIGPGNCGQNINGIGNTMGVCGRQNLSKYSTNGSITSHCTMPTTTTTSANDCPDLLNRSFSSGRYGYSSSGAGGGNWCNTISTTPYNTTNTSCGSNYHHHHHHHHHLPNHHHHHHHQQQQQPQQHQQYKHHSHQHPYATINNNHLNNYYRNQCHNDLITNSNTINNGRLHKSLSFAFQTPIMWNDCYQQQTAYLQNTQTAYNNKNNNRCYARCDIHPQYISTNGLQQNPSRSRSVPEGLANTAQNCECIWNYRNRWQSCSFRQPSTSSATLSTTATKPIQVVEQITTSV